MLAFALCLCMMLPLLASCAPVDLSYKGPILQMYLTQQIYDFDPLHAYNNEAQLKVVSLLYATLYKIDGSGKLVRDLVASEEIKENDITKDYTFTITLRDTCWSDGNKLDAEDVLTTIERVLLDENSNEASAILMDIKNAKAIKQGDATMGDLGVTAPNSKTIEFAFEHKIDYEQFKLGLASVALAPLPSEAIDHPDWAKKPVTGVYSGPFVIRKVSYEVEDAQLILERNSYYYRNRTEDATDKYVTPYRIVVDYTKTAEEQLEMYKAGQVLYVGDIPMSLRGEYKSSAKTADELSTHTYYLNQNALIASAKAGEEEGFALFSVAEVRKALSLAINRNSIAEAVVFAKAATAIVPNGVFAENSSSASFRSKVGDLIKATDDIPAAKALLTEAGINAGDYTFSISVREGDEVHVAIAEAVCAAWAELGFNVSIVKLGVENKQDNEKDESGEVQKDIRDDLFTEALEGRNYEVIALDLVATSVTASSVLAPFALDYSGTRSYYVDSKGNPYWAVTPHSCGYNSEDYNELITRSFAAETVGEKSALLVEAEKLLVEDMPVIPIVFNQDAYLASGELKGLGSSFFGYRDFSKVIINDWETYGITYGYIEIAEQPN